MKQKWMLVLTVCLITLSLLDSGCKGGDNDKKEVPAKIQSINIVTATTGGVYYPLGIAIAQLFNQNISGIKAISVATAGTAKNVQLMQEKSAEVAFVQNGVAYYAFNGTEMFKDKPMKFLRGITNLYPNVMHIVVAANSNIKTINDLEGKKIVPGSIGSATEIDSKEILELYGLNFKDMKSEYLGYSEAAEALKDGRVDGIIIAGGLPTSAVLDVAASLKIRILSMEPVMIGKLQETMPWYFAITIPKGTYMGQLEDVKTVAVANWLVCRDDLNNELVYNMTKTLYENQKDLVAAHSAAKDMRIQDALKGMTVPLHPGAERYYKEKGIVK